MKKIAKVILLIVCVYSCKNEIPKDYIKLSGKINNNVSDTLVLNNSTIHKNIIVNRDGTFSDTLKIPAARIFELIVNKQKNQTVNLFLKNGYNLQLTIEESGKEGKLAYNFTGLGAKENNFLTNNKTDILGLEKLPIYNLDKKAFGIKVESIVDSIVENYKSSYTNKGLDSVLVANYDAVLPFFKGMLWYNYSKKNYNIREVVKDGMVAPKFVNYENYNGTLSSLDDFKGKYIYIDFWATWCGPCINEIPFLKEVEKQYHGKNIVFLSISVDDLFNREKWKKKVKELELTGVQLISPNTVNADFTYDFDIKNIPRFVLIDPKGIVLKAKAPRPSQPELVELFDSLDI